MNDIHVIKITMSSKTYKIWPPGKIACEILCLMICKLGVVNSIKTETLLHCGICARLH